MPYALALRPAAERSLNALPESVFRHVDRHIQDLAQNPRPRGTKKLAGKKNFYRIRSGDYRIVYHVEDKTKVVTVTHVAHRREVYR